MDFGFRLTQAQFLALPLTSNVPEQLLSIYSYEIKGSVHGRVIEVMS